MRRASAGSRGMFPRHASSPMRSSRPGARMHAAGNARVVGSRVANSCTAGRRRGTASGVACGWGAMGLFAHACKQAQRKQSGWVGQGPALRFHARPYHSTHLVLSQHASVGQRVEQGGLPCRRQGGVWACEQKGGAPGCHRLRQRAALPGLPLSASGRDHTPTHPHTCVGIANQSHNWDGRGGAPLAVRAPVRAHLLAGGGGQARQA